MSATHADRTREAILADIGRRLAAVPDELLDAVTDPAVVGERMMDAIPQGPGVFGRLIGPVYSTRALTAMWGITRAAVSKRVRDGRLLALKVEGENLFPLFQFDGTRIRGDVIDLVNQLKPVTDPFTIAQWLRTPLSDHDGLTAIELLDSDPDTARTAAEHAAARWSA